MAWLWCRKSPYGCEFEAELRHTTTGKRSLSTPAESGYLFESESGYLFESGKDKAAKGEGWAPLFICLQYNGILTPTAPTTIRLWDTITFFIFEMNVTCNYNINHLNNASYQLLLVILKVLRIALQNSPHLNNVGIT